MAEVITEYICNYLPPGDNLGTPLIDRYCVHGNPDCAHCPHLKITERVSDRIEKRVYTFSGDKGETLHSAQVIDVAAYKWLMQIENPDFLELT